jgi:CO/xanthine dehydrogenase Mo-binding subunit
MPRQLAAARIGGKITMRFDRIGQDGDQPAGIKGIGELANVGANAAVANAVYRATGKHI